MTAAPATTGCVLLVKLKLDLSYNLDQGAADCCILAKAQSQDHDITASCKPASEPSAALAASESLAALAASATELALNYHWL